MELNPNHPMTRATHDLWHKLAAFVVHKYAGGHATLTLADMRAFGPDRAIVVEEKGDVMHLRIVSMEEGERLARKEGGLPV